MGGPNARVKNRCQNSGRIRVAVAFPLVIAAAVPVAAILSLVLAGEIAIQYLLCAWRWATESHDWDLFLRMCAKDSEFTLRDVPARDRKRFLAKLTELMREVREDAARAEREQKGERNGA